MGGAKYSIFLRFTYLKILKNVNILIYINTEKMLLICVYHDMVVYWKSKVHSKILINSMHFSLTIYEIHNDILFFVNIFLLLTFTKEKW